MVVNKSLESILEMSNFSSAYDREGSLNGARKLIGDCFTAENAVIFYIWRVNPAPSLELFTYRNPLDPSTAKVYLISGEAVSNAARGGYKINLDREKAVCEGESAVGYISRTL